MDLFGNVGTGELLVLILLALLLFGPEDLVKIVRTFRKYTEQARRAWNRLTAELEYDVLSDELQEMFQEPHASAMDAQQELQTIADLVVEETAVPGPETEPDPPLSYGP